MADSHTTSDVGLKFTNLVSFLPLKSTSKVARKHLENPKNLLRGILFSGIPRDTKLLKVSMLGYKPETSGLDHPTHQLLRSSGDCLACRV